MSHQAAKAEAERILRDLLGKHHPGFIVMIIRALHKIQRASKDLTIYAEKAPPNKSEEIEQKERTL